MPIFQSHHTIPCVVCFGGIACTFAASCSWLIRRPKFIRIRGGSRVFGTRGVACARAAHGTCRRFQHFLIWNLPPLLKFPSCTENLLTSKKGRRFQNLPSPSSVPPVAKAAIAIGTLRLWSSFLVDTLHYSKALELFCRLSFCMCPNDAVSLFYLLLQHGLLWQNSLK